MTHKNILQFVVLVASVFVVGCGKETVYPLAQLTDEDLITFTVVNDVKPGKYDKIAMVRYIEGEHLASIIADVPYGDSVIVESLPVSLMVEFYRVDTTQGNLDGFLFNPRDGETHSTASIMSESERIPITF